MGREGMQMAVAEGEWWRAKEVALKEPGGRAAGFPGGFILIGRCKGDREIGFYPRTRAGAGTDGGKCIYGARAVAEHL